MKLKEKCTQAGKSTSFTSTQMHLSDNGSAVHDYLNDMGQIAIETNEQVQGMNMKKSIYQPSQEFNQTQNFYPKEMTNKSDYHITILKISSNIEKTYT